MKITKESSYKEISIFLDKSGLTRDPSGSYYITLKEGVEIYCTPNWTDNGVISPELYVSEDLAFKFPTVEFESLNLTEFKTLIKKLKNHPSVLKELE